MRPPSWLELLPFAAALLSLSILPSALPHAWESRRFRLVWAAALAAASAVPALARGAGTEVLRAGGEYLDVVALLGSLFVISGGIALGGRLEGTPLVNVALLATGALLASVLGTPGAATLMIRPYLHANRRRKRVEHGVIFLIILAGNVGGSLLPIGDPPLYLGYLAGVPFFWTLSLWRPWIFVVGLALAAFFAWDLRRFRREGFEGEDETRSLSTIRLHGLVNLPILGAAIASSALLHGPARPAALVACAAISWRLTPKDVRSRNRFSLAPVEEIAVIFFAIFGTIAPVLETLSRHGAVSALSTPRAFFWAAGTFSSLLDNAPTYLAALSAARALPAPPGSAMIAGAGESFLRAISLGAVYFGALTYVGNGPNLLVRAIASERGVRMPGFVAYAAIASALMLPIFAAVSFLFL
jgi:Na+/H+ antiporter NhaD/arsenite permease-like protein